MDDAAMRITLAWCLSASQGSIVVIPGSASCAVLGRASPGHLTP